MQGRGLIYKPVALVLIFSLGTQSEDPDTETLVFAWWQYLLSSAKGGKVKMIINLNIDPAT